MGALGNQASGKDSDKLLPLGGTRRAGTLKARPFSIWCTYGCLPDLLVEQLDLVRDSSPAFQAIHEAPRIEGVDRSSAGRNSSAVDGH